MSTFPLMKSRKSLGSLDELEVGLPTIERNLRLWNDEFDWS